MNMFAKTSIVLALGFSFTAGPVIAANESAAPAAHAASQDIVNASEARKDQWRQEILSQINSYRASKGLYPLKYSRYISGIAQDESNRAVRDENYNHSMNFLKDRRAGTWNDAGEITALSYRISTKDIVDFWKKSPNHNKVLLSKTIDVIGIGTTEVDGMLTKKKEPWRLLAVVDGFSYAAGKAPGDTRTSVTGAKVASSTAGYSVRGAIATKYRAMGGAAKIGYPTMNERSATGGVYQVFKKGTTRTKILWSSSTGALAVKEKTAIANNWAAAGYERGHGFPSTDERRLSDGGVYQMFKKGNSMTKVMWKSGVGTGAIKENGAIGQQWKRAGQERGYGYPITNETRQRDGSITQKFKKGSRITTISWKSGRALWVY